MSRQTTACLLDRDPQQPEAANARFKMSRSFLVRKFDVAPDKSTWSKNALDKRFKSDSSRIASICKGCVSDPSSSSLKTSFDAPGPTTNTPMS